MPQQCLAQRYIFSIRTRPRFVAAATERAYDFLSQFRAIRRRHSERITDFITQAGAVERNLKMPGVFARTGTIQAEIFEENGGKEVNPRVTGTDFPLTLTLSLHATDYG